MPREYPIRETSGKISRWDATEEFCLWDCKNKWPVQTYEDEYKKETMLDVTHKRQLQLLDRFAEWQMIDQQGRSTPRHIPRSLCTCTFSCVSSHLQVAQLWHRNREKLGIFSINVQRYSPNYAQNCSFGPPMGSSVAIYALYLKFLTQWNLVTKFHRENVSFYSQNSEIAFLCHTFWGRD